MKKKLAVLVAAVAALSLSMLVLAGCSSDKEDTASAGFDGNLVVGFDAEYPPYGYMDEQGNYTGFDLELAQMVCDKNGWTFSCEPIDWDAKDALLNQGNITCIWNGFTYEGRETDYAWTDPYMLNAQVIVVKTGSNIVTEADLAGKTVVTQADSSALAVLEDPEACADLAATFAGGAPQQLADYNNAFMQLESGLVDAVACDYSIAAYQMAANPGAYEQVLTLSSEHYAVGFKLGNEDLAAQVNQALIELDNEGAIEALCEKYADQGISYENWCLGK
ncbi:MAG: transporter substrate-binding domain-containing protein [Eggerthellales bacterium]|nr:transporter substrate-binding domain-containing protein [Eggerthellales bacterium]